MDRTELRIGTLTIVTHHLDALLIADRLERLGRPVRLPPRPDPDPSGRFTADHP
jgi:hypothetical protein